MYDLPTPEELFDILKHTVNVGSLRGFPWKDLIKLSKPREAGEVRSRSDWENVPRQPGAIRLVVLRDKEGFVIRWATDGFLQRWGPGSNPTHEGLVGYKGDLPQQARSGYICISAEGEIRKVE